MWLRPIIGVNVCFDCPPGDLHRAGGSDLSSGIAAGGIHLNGQRVVTSSEIRRGRSLVKIQREAGTCM